MMRKTITIVVFLLLVLIAKSGQAVARDDWQLWNGYDLKVKLHEDFNLKVTGEQRFRDDFSSSFLGNVNAGFLWHPSSYFEIGPFFKYEREKQRSGFHVNERRWLLEGTLKLDLGPLKVSDRNRMAYRDRNTTDQWRYRNRLKVAWPVPVKKITIAPFVSEEIFWEINPGSLSQNRIQLGLDAKLTKNVAVSLYYMLKSNRKGSDWDDFHVLGTGLSLSF